VLDPSGSAPDKAVEGIQLQLHHEEFHLASHGTVSVVATPYNMFFGRYEEVGLPGELLSAQHAAALLFDPLLAVPLLSLLLFLPWRPGYGEGLAAARCSRYCFI
jgi:hypothetical protein